MTQVMYPPPKTSVGDLDFDPATQAEMEDAIADAVAGDAAALASALAGVTTALAGKKNITDPAIGFSVAGQNNLVPVRFSGRLTHAGPPVAGDGTFALDDIVFDSNGTIYRNIVAGTPGTWVAPGLAGMGIARASITTQETAADGAENDIAGMSINFDVPADRSVWVIAKIPYVGHSVASGTVTVKLTDAANTQKDFGTARSGTASRNHPTLMLDEVIAAGSGNVTRKLRSLGAGGAGGFVNGLGVGRITLDAFIR